MWISRLISGEESLDLLNSAEWGRSGVRLASRWEGSEGGKLTTVLIEEDQVSVFGKN